MVIFTTEILDSRSQHATDPAGDACVTNLNSSKFQINVDSPSYSKSTDSAKPITANSKPTSLKPHSSCEPADSEATGCDKRSSFHVLFKDYSKSWRYPRPLIIPKELPRDPIVGDLQVAQHMVSWNPNFGSHQWLAVGGQTGLLRIMYTKPVDL
jgi:hypothetical protein